MTHETRHPERMPAEQRIRVVARDGRLYLDADDLVAMLRARAAQYLARADELTAAATDPRTLIEPLDRDLITVIDEALACRMVAEELNQRADVLERIG